MLQKGGQNVKKQPIRDLKSVIIKVDSYIAELAKEHDVEHLAGPQGHVVVFLYDHRDEKLMIKDIEQRLDISKSVASNLVKRMERNGFVTTEPSPIDKRSKIIQLTDLGSEKAKKMVTFFEFIRNDLLEGISKEDLEITRKVGLQLKKNLEKRGN